MVSGIIVLKAFGSLIMGSLTAIGLFLTVKNFQPDTSLLNKIDRDLVVSKDKWSWDFKTTVNNRNKTVVSQVTATNRTFGLRTWKCSIKGSIPKIQTRSGEIILNVEPQINGLKQAITSKNNESTIRLFSENCAKNRNQQERKDSTFPYLTETSSTIDLGELQNTNQNYFFNKQMFMDLYIPKAESSSPEIQISIR